MLISVNHKFIAWKAPKTKSKMKIMKKTVDLLMMVCHTYCALAGLKSDSIVTSNAKFDLQLIIYIILVLCNRFSTEFLTKYFNKESWNKFKYDHGMTWPISLLKVFYSCLILIKTLVILPLFLLKLIGTVLLLVGSWFNEDI